MAEVKRRDSDQEICERNSYSGRLRLCVDSSGAQRNRHRYGMNRHRQQEIVEKLLTAGLPARRICASNAVGQFHHGNYRQSQFRIVVLKDRCIEGSLYY